MMTALIVKKKLIFVYECRLISDGKSKSLIKTRHSHLKTQSYAHLPPTRPIGH